MGGHRPMLEEQHRFLEAGHEMDAQSDLLLFPLVLYALETWEESNHTDDASRWVSYRPENK
jgi:hypothetical protein